MKPSFHPTLRLVLRAGACVAIALLIVWETVHLDGVGQAPRPTGEREALVLVGLASVPLVAPLVVQLNALLNSR